MTDLAWHAPDGRRFTIYSSACTHPGCYRARCECGTLLTAHDFTAHEARLGALEVLASSDTRPGFGHPLEQCRR